MGRIRLVFYLCHGMNSCKELLLSSMLIRSFSPYVLFLVVVAFWIEWFSSCGALYFIECHLCLDVWMDCALISGMGMKAIKRTQWLKPYCIFSVPQPCNGIYLLWNIKVYRIHTNRHTNRHTTFGNDQQIEKVEKKRKISYFISNNKLSFIHT